MPKKLWADLHIIPDHPVDTHGAFLLLFFFASTLRSVSVFNATGLFIFYLPSPPLLRTVCLHPNENIEERLCISARPGQG